MVTSGTGKQPPVQVQVTMRSGRVKPLQFAGAPLVFANAGVAKAVCGNDDLWAELVAETFPGETAAEARCVELVTVEGAAVTACEAPAGAAGASK